MSALSRTEIMKTGHTLIQDNTIPIDTVETASVSYEIGCDCAIGSNDDIML